MAAPVVAPCEPWITDLSCCPAADGVDPDEVTLGIMAATEVLWAFSGRQFGLCTNRVRPCRSFCADGMMGWYNYGSLPSGPWPVMYQGQWINLTCGCGRRRGCSCTEVCEVDLSKWGPIASIESVMVDGVELVVDVDYRVDDWSRLVRLGGDCWPLCQDLNVADDAVGAWTVEWTSGQDVPASGILAVRELGCEMVKFCSTGECRLPRRTTNVSREGLSYTVMDPFEFFERRRTGLYLCDAFLTAMNPHALMQQSQVWWPEQSPTGVVTGT